MLGPENGGTPRRTMSKHKAVKEESLERWGLELTKGGKYPNQNIIRALLRFQRLTHAWEFVTVLVVALTW